MGSGLDWQIIAEDLADNYYCLIPDLPGHGLTTVHGGDDNYQMEILSPILIQWLRNMKISRSSLLGYSMGGRLALYLLVENPHIWQTLILESSSPGLRSKEERSKRIKNDEKLAKKLEDSEFNTFLWEWYHQPIFNSLRENSDLEGLIFRRMENDPRNLAISLKMMGTGIQPSLWGDLSKIDIPVLLLVGEFDRKFTTIMTQMEKTLLRTELKVVPNAGHNSHFEQPVVFMEYIYDFLRHFGREVNESG